MEAYLTLFVASTMALVMVAIVAERASSSVPQPRIASLIASGHDSGGSHAAVMPNGYQVSVTEVEPEQQNGSIDATIELDSTGNAARQAADIPSRAAPDARSAAIAPRTSPMDGAPVVDAKNESEVAVVEMPHREISMADRLTDLLADSVADQQAGYEHTVEPSGSELVLADRFADWIDDQTYQPPLDQPTPPIPDERLALEALQVERKLKAAGTSLGHGEVPFASFLLANGKTALLDETPTGSLPPLVDRRLSLSDRTRGLDPGLVEAMVRIEPLFDPTPDFEAADFSTMRISAGTASTSNVFGERWQLASDDPSINLRAAPIGLVWSGPTEPSCASYDKSRRYDASDLTLDGLSTADCARLQQRLRNGAHDAPPIPLAVASFDPPTFAAPLPGARQSSEAFWIAQRAKIMAIEARLHSKWSDQNRAE